MIFLDLLMGIGRGKLVDMRNFLNVAPGGRKIWGRNVCTATAPSHQYVVGAEPHVFFSIKLRDPMTRRYNLETDQCPQPLHHPRVYAQSRTSVAFQSGIVRGDGQLTVVREVAVVFPDKGSPRSKPHHHHHHRRSRVMLSSCGSSNSLGPPYAAESSRRTENTLGSRTMSSPTDGRRRRRRPGS